MGLVGFGAYVRGWRPMGQRRPHVREQRAWSTLAVNEGWRLLKSVATVTLVWLAWMGFGGLGAYVCGWRPMERGRPCVRDNDMVDRSGGGGDVGGCSCG